MSEREHVTKEPLTTCACESPDARHDKFETRVVPGYDETDGRFAEVTLKRCLSCGRLWLRYFVEYEGFSRSGRWARGLIDDDTAERIMPQTALAHLNALSWYLYGGSYFEGRSGRRTGPMRWEP